MERNDNKRCARVIKPETKIAHIYTKTTQSQRDLHFAMKLRCNCNFLLPSLTALSHTSVEGDKLLQNDDENILKVFEVDLRIIAGKDQEMKIEKGFQGISNAEKYLN